MLGQLGIMSGRNIPADSSPQNVRRSNDNNDLDCIKLDEMLDGFQNQEPTPDDLPSCMCRSPADSEYETSDFLLHDYQRTFFSFPSSSWRFQEVGDGKKTLMELIQNMPEPFYELSSRDIVDDERIPRRDARNSTIRKDDSRPDIRGNNLPRANKITRARVESSPGRAKSMQSGAFQLKMFIPVSLGFNKMLKIRNCSRVLSRPFFEGHAKPITNGGCKTKMAFSRERGKKMSECTTSKKMSENR